MTVLPGAPGNRCHATETSQSLIVSPSHGIVRFCEQRGEDDPADAWKRVQDVHVTLPRCPRFFLRRYRRAGQYGRQAAHLAVSPGKLLAGDGELREDHLKMGHSSLAGAWSNGDRRLAQPLKHVFGTHPANPVALQEVGDGPGADAARLLRSRHQAPEFACPGPGEIAFDPEKLRVVAPELLAGTVDEARLVAGEIAGNARPLAEFDDFRCLRIQAPESLVVGSQGIGQRPGVTAIVLGAGGRPPVAEAVELLRVDGVDRETAFHHRLDNGSVRNLDGNCDGMRLCVGCIKEPVGHLRESGAAVREGAFAQRLAVAVNDKDLVRFRAPIDSCKELKTCHGIPFNELCQRAATMPARPCTGAQGAKLPTGHPSWPGTEARVLTRCSKRGGHLVTPGPLARPVCNRRDK